MENPVINSVNVFAFSVKYGRAKRTVFWKGACYQKERFLCFMELTLVLSQKSVHDAKTHREKITTIPNFATLAKSKGLGRGTLLKK
ncbi:MAG: hypothetical protein R3Y06_02700 [Faecalibacterium sp.]